MGEGFEEFWSNVPEEAMQPSRMKLLEALRGIGKPLSARQLVDVLDGEVSMWEAERHLRALGDLGVVKPAENSSSEEKAREDDFDVRYRLEDQDPDAEE